MRKGTEHVANHSDPSLKTRDSTNSYSQSYLHQLVMSPKIYLSWQLEAHPATKGTVLKSYRKDFKYTLVPESSRVEAVAQLLQQL